MDWLKIFRAEKKSSAQTAKERLLITVAHQRQGEGNGLHFLPRLREELLAVVRKYVQVPDEAVQFNVQRDEGLEVLELNITLPEKERRGGVASH
ncbi:MAG: cell division topological specificity factor MinE [Nevskiaceae bacterium]|nr:MAG: cell division topological specificity factor MinE [Nevskiaceae bacterium]TBR71324.1 MAG: cell division topological specificity factor MinE [Nevskiaceae bacterium]